MKLGKYIYKLLAIGCTVGTSLLGGCINDQMQPCPDMPGDNTIPGVANPLYYIEVNVQVPKDLGSRANENENANTGADPLAAANELKVEDVDLYFLKADNTISGGVTTYDKNKILLKLSTKDATENIVTQDENTKSLSTAKILVDDEGFTGLSSLAGKKVNLLVVCNPDEISYNGSEGDDAGVANFNITSKNLVQLFGDDNKGKILPMANAGVYELTSFEDITSNDPDEIITAIKRLFVPKGAELVHELNPLDVERAVARFDLGSVNTQYTVGGMDNELNLQMFAVAPFNVNNASYVARHVAGSDGTEAGENHFFLERETTANTFSYDWRIDPSCNWDVISEKYTKEKADPEENRYYSSPLSVEKDEDDNTKYFLKDEYANFTTITDLTATGKNPIEGYYPWMYVTENTIPVSDMWSDENLPFYATGVAFKFLILDTEDNPLTFDSDKRPADITFNKENANDKSITIKNSKGEFVVVTPETVTVGNDEKEYYFLTYYGFIKHGEEAQTYSVVRNYVYQLSVASIGDLPQPEKPTSYFLALDIKILAWVKRDIEVEF